MKFVSIIMGSKSDFECVNECAKILESLEIPYEMIVSSAHRSPQRTVDYVKEAEKNGAVVFICAAGMAAHLAGAVAANTIKPVIGIPVGGGSLNGVDALYSTVQMPAGMPVATLAIGRSGAKNAGFLAVQILAIEDKNLANKLLEIRQNDIKKIEEDSKNIEVRLKI